MVGERAVVVVVADSEVGKIVVVEFVEAVVVVLVSLANCFFPRHFVGRGQVSGCL